MTETNVEIQLPKFVAELDRVISDLTAPQSRTIYLDSGETTTVTKPSLWEEMGLNLTGPQKPPGSGGGGVSKSTPPLRLDAIDWLAEVDSQARKWLPGTSGTTVDLLNQLNLVKWTPLEVHKVRAIARKILSWIAAAESFLDNRATFEVKAACPACDQKHAYRTNELGERVKKTALQVSSTECVCLACGYSWGAAYFALLASTIEQRDKAERGS